MEIKDNGLGYPSAEEIKNVCKLGQGADCCIWLMFGLRFECHFFRRPTPLVDQFKRGVTTAKRDGCDLVKSLANPPEIKTIEAKTFGELLRDEDYPTMAR